jgi:hypothetical protein
MYSYPYSQIPQSPMPMPTPTPTTSSSSQPPYSEIYRDYYASVARYMTIASNTRLTINRFANILFNQEAHMRDIINHNYTILSNHPQFSLNRQNSIHSFTSSQSHTHTHTQPYTYTPSQSHTQNLYRPPPSNVNNASSSGTHNPFTPTYRHILNSYNHNSNNNSNTPNENIQSQNNNISQSRYSLSSIRQRQLEQQQYQRHLPRNITPTPILFDSTFMTPVIVFPSQEQINRSSRLIMFDAISSPINNSCPITHEIFSNDEMVLQLACGHIFNNDAIRIWFRTNVRCPICRYDIRDVYSSNNANANANDNNVNANNNENENDTNANNNEENENENNTNEIMSSSQDSTNTYTTRDMNYSDISNNLITQNIMNQIFQFIRNDLSSNETDIEMEYTFMTPDLDFSRLIPIHRRVLQDSSGTTNLRIDSDDDDYDERR